MGSDPDQRYKDWIHIKSWFSYLYLYAPIVCKTRQRFSEGRSDTYLKIKILQRYSPRRKCPVAKYPTVKLPVIKYPGVNHTMGIFLSLEYIMDSKIFHYNLKNVHEVNITYGSTCPVRLWVYLPQSRYFIDFDIKLIIYLT